MRPASEAPSPRAQFHALQEQARATAERGQFEAAAAIYEEARSLAEKIGDQELIDRATCNRATLAIHLGQGQVAVRDLQMILMRSTSSRNRHLAAYSASHFYDLEEQPAKRLRYARLALEYAEQVDDSELIARSHNLLANMLLVDSYFAEAGRHYLLALAEPKTSAAVASQPVTAASPAMSAERAAMMANLGYCHHIDGEHSSGFNCLFQAIRTLRRLLRDGQLSCAPMLARAHLGLTYGYLEIERFASAGRHSAAALECAREAGDIEAQKKSLFMGGEVAKAAGDSFTAYDFFCQLQSEFHSDKPELADLLMATDSRKLINLMA